MKNFTRLLAVLLCMAIPYSISAQTVYPDYNDGQIYIKIKNAYPLGKAMSDNIPVGQVAFLNKVAAKYGITKVRQPFYRSKSVDMRQVYKVYFNNYVKVFELIRDMQTESTVEYAERVPLIKSCLTPNDLGTQSWTNGNWSLFTINAQTAWDNTTGNTTNTQVAIVDNAVQITHTDLSANIYINPGEIANNNIDDDGNGYVDDVNGWDTGDNDNNPMPPNTSYDHGTHCAGIASATTNNGTGVASIGYSVKIIPVKATGNNDGANSVSAGYEGVDYAISAGADIISMSWGGGGSSQTEQTLFNFAFNQGVLCIAAAGNDNVTTVFYPAGYNNVMSVASTGNGGANDQKSSFSNYGSWIDISAPGANIRSTVPTNAYAILSGTSMACPLVAGLAGLIHSINPNLTPTQIENCIESTATNINSSNSSYVGQLGAGRINAQAATACAIATVTPYDASILSVNAPVGAACQLTYTPQITLKNTGQTTLTAVTIGWQVDGGTVTNYNWTGSLASQAQVNVTLPNITVLAGNHTYTVTSGATVNGSQNDGNATNNSASGSFTALSSTGQVLPFNDDFESGSFTTKGWTVINPDNATTWNIVTTAGQQAGTKSATVNFFNYATTGQRDGLVTPTLNLSGLSSATLAFEYAYKRYNNNGTPSATDSMVVLVSTDCGATYPFRIFAGGESGAGNFSTAASSATEFIPAATDDWCFGAAPGVSVCPSISLNQFLGQSIRVKFESWNNYGNNLYLDDVNITGVTSIQPPTPSFTASATTICAGQSITFNSTSTGSPTSILWTFPGGSPGTSTQTSQAVTFATAGTYVVTLAATNQGGTNTTTQTITVNAIPSVTVTPATAAICAGSNVVLTANGGTTYTWSPGTGLSATTGSTVTANPTQTITYTITGTTNGCSGTTTKVVTVTPLPVVTVTPANATICSGSNVTLTANGGTTYTWSPGTGLSATTGAAVTAGPTQTITYTITGTTNGCSGTTTKTVTVNPTPSLIASAVDNSLCLGEQATLNVTGGGTYTWSGNGLNSTSGASVTANPAQTTTYSVSSTVAGCTGTSTVQVTVNQLPTVGVSASDNNLCVGSPSTLTATGAQSFVWNGGDITGLTTNPVIVNPAQTTTYTVTGTDGNGCTNTGNVTVNVNGTAPSLNATTNKDTICEGTTITLSATGATNYSWTGNGLNSTSGSDVTANPTQSTTFVVSSSDGGCNATAQISVFVNAAPNTPSISINNGMLVSSPATYYQWYFNGQPIQGATNQAYTPTQDGNYSVQITDANGCSSTSSDFAFTTSVNEAAFGGKVSIFPNPSFGEAFIDITMNKPSHISIRLFNSVGQTLDGLQSVESLGGRFALPVSGLPSGIYMVEITAGGKQLVKKLVIAN